MSCVGAAPLKLLLFGEHAAVYGYPALGIPLPWKITVSIKQTQSFMWDADTKYNEQLNTLTPNIYRVFPELEQQPLYVKVKADIPVGVGFGSSGALCVALTRAIFQLLSITQDNQEVWKRAHLLEAHFHKHPSGVDTGLSAWERCGYFVGQNASLPSFKILPGFSTPIIVGALPRSKSTGELVLDLRGRLKEEPSLKSSLTELGKISEKAQNCLDDAFQFGLLANQAQHHLSILGLSTPDLDCLLETAVNLGALGGKLSGAGCGGAFYLVCQTFEKAVDIANALSGNALGHAVKYSIEPAVIPDQEA